VSDWTADIVRTLLRDYIVLIAATLLCSAGFAFFLIPAKLSSGGVSGLAVVMHYEWNVPTGLMIFLLNVPLLIIGYIFLGGLRFTIRTIVSVVVFAATVDPMGHLVKLPLTHDAFLAALYGGVIMGVGVGLVFGCGASTGGTTIVSRLLQRVTHGSIGIIQVIVDGIIIVIIGIAFGPQLALYSLVGLFVSGKAIDWTLEGSSGERLALVVTNHSDEISDRITDDLGRGVTVLQGRGGFTGEERPVLMCVLDRSEEPMLRALVQASDPRAFVVVAIASTVLGEGFAPLKPSVPLRQRLFPRLPKEG
jgi:uncharacterized membrane-anchored protein YitT (DUF2179 family)